ARPFLGRLLLRAFSPPLLAIRGAAAAQEHLHSPSPDPSVDHPDEARGRGARPAAGAAPGQERAQTARIVAPRAALPSNRVMITIVFAGFLLLSMSVALIDWRRGWLMAILCGILQDPARKLTPGSPVALTLSVMLVYAIILFSGSGSLQHH